jgi:ABC-2 type transport system ATP-binding protein
MIEVESLTKRFGPIVAIDDLSFQVGAGEILGFLGPNGAGKTTTMRILTGFMPASAGTARVAGFDIARDSLAVRRRIGYLPESVPVYPERPVIDYLNFVADVKGMPARGRTRALGELIERCGLGGVRHRLVGRLSRGFRQRVGLAQALVNDPPVLVLDEPTVGLDPGQVVEIRSLIREMAGRKTVILSTHILPEVSQVCSRVVIINKGRIAGAGTPDELTARLTARRGFRVRVAGRAAAAAGILAGLPGIVAVVPEAEGEGASFRVETELDVEVRAAISRALVGAGCELLELVPLPMTLEEIFLSLVREEPAGPAGGGAAPDAGPPGAAAGGNAARPVGASPEGGAG